MQIFRFDPAAGRAITAFGSREVRMSRVVQSDGETLIGCIHLQAGGVVGYHQATGPQLFLVVQGTGWVRGEELERSPITAGQAAFWTTNEWHESGTEDGMMVIVIEGPALDPLPWMPPASR